MIPCDTPLEQVVRDAHVVATFKSECKHTDESTREEEKGGGQRMNFRICWLKQPRTATYPSLNKVCICGNSGEITVVDVGECM